jgi:NAD(P)-dependent dehydrogenase (short-subunit alcohol dehydrogenase family)
VVNLSGMQISDTAAIVTGGASGLGGATARALAGQGARVFALDLPNAVDKAEPVEGISYLAADVTDPDQVSAAVDTAAGAGVPLRIVVMVNTASIAAFDGQIGQVAYAASKGGVVGLTLSAARDLASFGIRVVTIAPGIIDTPMLAGVTDEFRAGLAGGVPFPKRLGQPAEYAGLAVSIIEQDYLNGEVIRLDGALRMAPR